MNTRAVDTYSQEQYAKIDTINKSLRDHPEEMLAKLVFGKASSLEKQAASAGTFVLDAKWGELTFEWIIPSYDEVFNNHDEDFVTFRWQMASEWVRVWKEIEIEPMALVKAPKDEVDMFIYSELNEYGNLMAEVLCKAAENLGY